MLNLDLPRTAFKITSKDEAIQQAHQRFLSAISNFIDAIERQLREYEYEGNVGVRIPGDMKGFKHTAVIDFVLELYRAQGWSIEPSDSYSDYTFS